MTCPFLSDHTFTFHGRRQGRALRGLKKELFDRDLSKVSLTPDLLAAIPSQHGVLEMGFGCGEHLAAQAMHNPNKSYVGIEIFKNGIATLLQTMHLHALTNIKIFPHDGRVLFPHIPKACFQEIYILFPDPWPKKKHGDRRLLNEESLRLFSSWLKPQGHLIIASDDRAYQDQIEKAIQGTDLSYLPAYTPLITTRYEEKALKARRIPRYFALIKQR